MDTYRIEFSPAQRAALLWRLQQGDLIAEVFADTSDLEHLQELAAARADDLQRQLVTHGHLVVNADELDREILSEAIAGSTYLSAFDPANNTDNTPQGLAAAKRSLAGAWTRIAQAYTLSLDDIVLPEA
ncbi:hypothetical protein [Comamonas thiooxydans]|uniref:hypothetical protein n=1 Tax=Comamonas thiooxydans TaxID=363952 RepID=UPI000B414764|nr:hypothetical protein [Comamonas thiooxydans]